MLQHSSFVRVFHTAHLESKESNVCLNTPEGKDEFQIDTKTRRPRSINWLWEDLTLIRLKGNAWVNKLCEWSQVYLLLQCLLKSPMHSA